jgi:uncharacterized protein involved in exopolysaccharide biosynthesis
MAFEWNLRDEILAITHRWPLPLLAFLLGCVAGWGVAWLAPPTYRAETRLAVAYNGDAIYRNPDDYKNWQMEQLETLAISPDVIARTLEQLRLSDPAWENISADELRALLRVSWRNTGTWRLTATSPDRQQAIQAVVTWTDVFMELFDSAYRSASDLNVANQQLYSLVLTQTQFKARAAEMAGVLSTLSAWRASAAQGDVTSPLGLLERWRLWSLAARASNLDVDWGALLEQLPSPEAPRQEYLAWLDQVLASLTSKIEVLQSQIQAMEGEIATVNTRFLAAADQSHGLSAMVLVEKLAEGLWQVRSTRPTGVSMLIGGVLGLILWLLFWLVRLGWRYRAPQPARVTGFPVEKSEHPSLPPSNLVSLQEEPGKHA